jgi:DHA2 family multidrug resistance protein
MSRPSDAPARAWLVYAAMILGMFMAVLDIQIVASSLGELQAGLAAAADEVSWVQTAYLIAEVIAIPLTGILVRLLSTRVLFVISCFGFTLASAACALAWDLPSMAALRALQGFLGGAMIPLVFSMPYRLFPPHQQKQAIIFVGLTATLAPTLGPVIGGWITEELGWRWLFLANVAPGLLAGFAVWRLLDVDRADPSVRKGFDWIGLVLMALFLGSLQFMLEEGTRWDWFESERIRRCAALAVASGALFLWRALLYRRPIVELRAFADRNFTIGCVLSFFFGVGIYGSTYLLPLFLGQIHGDSALQIGAVMAVTGAFQFLSAPLAGALSDRIDLRLMLSGGLLLFGTGLILNAGMTAESHFAELFWPQAVRGLALMLCFLPINTIALGTLPLERLANASGLYNLMRNLGGAIGLAVIDTLYDQRLFLHVTRLQESLTQADIATSLTIDRLSSRIAEVLSTAEAPTVRLLSSLVRREAAVMAFNDVFLVLGIALLAGLLLIPSLRREQHRVPL